LRNRRLSFSLAFFLVLILAPFGVSTSQSFKTVSFSPQESYSLSSNGYDLAYDGVAGPDSSVGNYTLTWDDEMTDYDGIKNTAGEAYVILNFSAIQNFGGFNYSVLHASYGGADPDDGNSELWVYDFLNDEWEYLGDGGQGLGGWTNGTLSGSKYSEDSEILIKCNSTDSDSAAGVAVMIAWLEIFAGPPWLDGYSYRTEIYLNASADAGTNYVMKWKVLYDGGTDVSQYIYCTKHCQTDFGDIRWTEDDGITELNYYLDYYQIEAGLGNTFGIFYVQISANLTESDQLIYIYYGTQGTTTTTSSGPNTFYEWLDADDTGGWTKQNIAVSNYGGYLRFYNPDFGLTGKAERYDLNYPNDHWRMFVRLKTISLGAWDRNHIWNVDGSQNQRFTEFIAPFHTDQTHYYYWNGSQTQGLSWVEGDEYVVQITVRESKPSNGVDYHVFYSDAWTAHGLKQNNEFRYGSPTSADGIILGDIGGSSFVDVRVKYFAFMKKAVSEPFTKDYGLEEGSGEFTSTTTTTTMTFIHETWGFNAAFAIMGLVMIPVSGLYLVKGGRQEMSRNKLFYVLVAFFIGWAFLIGVIVP